MASLRDIELRNYCDSVYNELSGMKTKLLGFMKEIEQMTGPEKEILKPHIPHFQDIIHAIDWKLEILTKVCLFVWTGYTGDVEETASIPVQEEMLEKESVAGGYIGG